MIDLKTWLILADRIAEIRRERYGRDPHDDIRLEFDEFDQATVVTPE